jgi:UDP-MurNAc hydroxylase
MRFQILSHAGLAVTTGGRTLVTDPWLIGSCYWRSWWNYPPVSPDLVSSLKPDFIYLTHIHWDHFHGPSLRLFDRATPIYVPKGNFHRIKDDLAGMGFRDVRELRHGQSVELTPSLRITLIFLDSAIVIESEGITILNANDAKPMGGPLRQIVRRHPRIDFVLRSHSSANSRLSYELIDAPTEPVDDISEYIESFAQFTASSGATYAIPFASNHCHLHRDTFKFNDIVQTPHMVRDYFAQHRIENPILKVMASGDSWSTEGGFSISDHDYFDDRDRRLEQYRREKHQSLSDFYVREGRAKVTLQDMQKYFADFCAAVPFWVRRWFKDRPLTYVLTAGGQTTIYSVDIHLGRVESLSECSDETNARQIHTSAFIMRSCLKMNLFSHLAISKRVRYRVRKRERRYVAALNLLFNCYEYDLLPMRRMFRLRFFETWLLRWREVLLYFQLLRDRLVYGRFRLSRYFPPRVRADALRSTQAAAHLAEASSWPTARLADQ